MSGKVIGALPRRRLKDRVEMHARAATTSNYRRDIIEAGPAP